MNDKICYENLGFFKNYNHNKEKYDLGISLGIGVSRLVIALLYHQCFCHRRCKLRSSLAVIRFLKIPSLAYQLNLLVFTSFALHRC